MPWAITTYQLHFLLSGKKGRLWKICGTLHKFSSLSHTNLIDVDPIASLWCLLTRIPLDCLGGVLNSDKSYFHVNSPLCPSQTLRDSCCSSLCLAHGRFEDPSNLVFKLIIALIWDIRSLWVNVKQPCKDNKRSMQSQWRQDFGLLRKDRSRVRGRLITINYEESTLIWISKSSHNNSLLRYRVSTS